MSFKNNDKGPHRNSEVPRTIKIYHGEKMYRPFEKEIEDPETGEITIEQWERPLPSGGVRILNVHPGCNEAAEAIAQNLGGFIVKPSEEKDWKSRKYVAPRLRKAPVKKEQKTRRANKTRK